MISRMTSSKAVHCLTFGR